MNATKIQIPTQLKLAIDRHKIITFDVFDTLLIRRVAEPHDVFRLIEYKSNLNNFTTKRILAEQKARKNTIKEEVSLFDIYNEDSTLTKELMRKELETEASVLCANLPIKAIFDYCLNINRRIFIISDTYLPKSFIEGILKREGYTDWEDLFVSSDEGKTKRTGNLFRKIINDRHLPSESILHIGDNPNSDALQSIECKIQSYLYEYPLKTLLNYDHRFKMQFQEDDSLPSHLLLGLISSKFTTLAATGNLIQNKKEIYQNNSNFIKPLYPPLDKDEDYWFKFGYTVAGPAVAGFSAWIADRVEHLKIQTVLFVGRDGYILTKIFKKFYPSINCKYIYAPRYVKAAYAAKYALDSDASNFTSTDLITLIDVFIIRKWLPEYWQAPIIDNAKERLRFLRNDIFSIRQRINTIIDDYISYIKEQNLTAIKGNIAIVDSYTINFSSQLVLSNVLSNTNVIGLYWKTIDNSKNKHLAMPKFESFQKGNKGIKDWNLMEWILSAPHPGISYINGNDLIFNNVDKNETIRDSLYPLMETGILTFAEDFIKTFSDFNCLSNSSLIISWINKFCFYPSESDKNHFKNIKHASDAASKRWEDCMQTWSTDPEKTDNIFKKLLFYKSIRGENEYWNIFYIPFVRIKNRVIKKRWYIFGIPILERRAKVDGYSFYLFRYIPIFSLKRIDHL